MNQRILIVEDEPGLVFSLTDRLTFEGYQVETAQDGKSGFEKAASEPFDLILLDVMLPGCSGFEVCFNLRKRKIKTPVLMLTARGQVIDRVTGLKLGADDYLVKPFEDLELLARIEALLRRTNQLPPEPTGNLPAAQPLPESNSQTYQFGNVTVDFRSAEVWRGGEQVEIPAREFKLLCYLIENRGATISRDTLLDEVWGYDAMPYTRTVDVHIAGLRQKLEADARNPQHILTIHGLGYKFVG